MLLGKAHAAAFGCVRASLTEAVPAAGVELGTAMVAAEGTAVVAVAAAAAATAEAGLE